MVTCIERLHFQLTFTFVVEAASVIIIDFDSFASVGTDALLYSGTGSRCLCDIAIGADSCGTVADLPGLSILDGYREAVSHIGNAKSVIQQIFRRDAGLFSPPQPVRWAHSKCTFSNWPGLPGVPMAHLDMGWDQK